MEMDDKETESEATQNSVKEESIKATESLGEVVKTTETGSEVNNSQPKESKTLLEAGEKLEALAEGSDPPAKPSQPESTETKTPKSLKSKPKIVKKKKKSVAANGPKKIANKGKAIRGNKKKVTKAVSQGSKSGNNDDGARKISSDQQAKRDKEKVMEPEKSQQDLEKESQNAKVVGNEEHSEKSPDKGKNGESVNRGRRSRKGKKPGGRENKETDLETKKTDVPLKKKEKTDGLIFMCSKKTKPDCFRYRVMGVSIGNKETVMGIKRGMKLFLYDFDRRLMYGVYKATGSGGVKLEPKAFGGNFPAQVRFEVHKDCLPLPEAVFKKAIKENYNDKNKFKTELTSSQVKKLMSLFRPADVHTSILTAEDNKNSHKAAETRDKVSIKEEKKEQPSHSRREERDRDSHRNGDSGSRRKRDRDRDRDRGPRESRWDSSPRKNLFLTEREYRTFGLRGENRIPTPPPTLLPSDPFRRDYERERDPPLRHSIIPPIERDYRHHHDYSLGSGLNPYPSDPYYSRYYGTSTVDSSYLPPPRREDVHPGSSLYSRRESYLLENESLRRREDIDSSRRREIEHLERLYSTYGPENAPSHQRAYNASRLEDLPASSRYRDAPSYLYR